MLINAVTIYNLVATIFETNANLMILASAINVRMLVLPMKKDIE